MLSHVRKLLTGSALGQFIQLLATFVLARMYEPAQFGVAAQVQSMAMIVAIFATLQLHLTIPMSTGRAGALSKVIRVERIALVLLGLTILPALAYDLRVAASVLLASILSIANISNAYLLWQGNFTAIGRFHIIRAVLIVFFQLVLVKVSGINGVLVGILFGELLSAALLRSWAIGRKILPTARLSGVISFIRRNKEFSLYGTFQECVSVAAFYAPLFVFLAKQGHDAAGQYSMASRFIWGPIVLVSSSLAQVLYRTYCQSIPATIGRVIANKVVLAVAACAALGAGIVYVCRPVVVSLLGQQWELAADLMVLNLLWGSAFLFGIPIRVAFRAMRMQETQLYVELFFLLAALLISTLLTLSVHQTMGVFICITVAQNIVLSVRAAKSMSGRPASMTGAAQGEK